MNKEDHSEAVRSLQGRYQSSSVPTALLDAQLRVLWANPAALAIHPSLKLPDGFWVLAPQSLTDGFFAAVAENTLGEALNFVLPFSTQTLSLIPYEGGEGAPSCYILHSVVSNEVGTALKPAGSERLVSAFSNQFRMPLTSIFSTLSVFRSSPTLEDNLELNDYLQNINENCYQMLRSALDITEYLKHQSVGQALNLGQIDICDYLHKLCEAVHILTDNSGIPLTWELPEEGILLQFDQGQLTLALLQLINNSCRYTREGNAITITLKETAGQVMIAVRDRGVGIPSEIQEQVFSPYFSHDPFGGPVGGLGLGLTLAKQIITQHGGTVALSSVEGEGTSVVFTLPKGESGGNLIFRSPPNSGEYLLDRFSPVYVLLCDCCTPPKP